MSMRMSIEMMREKAATAYGPRTKIKYPVNIDIVQAMAGVLVEQCFQAKLDVLRDVIETPTEDRTVTEIVLSKIEEYEKKLADAAKANEERTDEVRSW